MNSGAPRPLMPHLETEAINALDLIGRTPCCT